MEDAVESEWYTLDGQFILRKTRYDRGSTRQSARVRPIIVGNTIKKIVTRYKYDRSGKLPREELSVTESMVYKGDMYGYSYENPMPTREKPMEYKIKKYDSDDDDSPNWCC